jgi:hypothetical protein
MRCRKRERILLGWYFSFAVTSLLPTRSDHGSNFAELVPIMRAAFEFRIWPPRANPSLFFCQDP